MAWAATITAVLENPVPNDTRNVIVRYSDGVREINRTYNIHANSFPTVDTTVSFIKDQVDKLNAFDQAVVDLEELVGTEIV
jgi:hypothetical protein